MKIVPSAISKHFATQHLLLQKNSPSILLGVGITSGIASTVLACRATLKIEDVLAENTFLRDQVTIALETKDDYTERDAQKDRGILIVRSTVQLGRLYAPAIGLGIVSVAALTKSHSILNERNAAITAAYAAVAKGFDEYRTRVVDKYGEDEDRELRYGSRKVTIKDKDTGRNKTVNRVAVDGEPSIYAKWFERSNKNFQAQPEYNLLFLRQVQQWMNDKLGMQGHLFLNEVYDGLGLERTEEGAVCGWMSDALHGDGYVDFGVFIGNEGDIDFYNGDEGAILLDFNVDGIVFDLINKKGKE